MKPNIIVDDTTRKILAFGFCDFSEQIQAGQTQYPCPLETLPNSIDVYQYDSSTDRVSVSGDLLDEKERRRKKAETETLAGEKADALLLEKGRTSRRKMKAISRAIKLAVKKIEGTISQTEQDELDASKTLDDQLDAIYDAADTIVDEIDIDSSYDHTNSPLWP